MSFSPFVAEKYSMVLLTDTLGDSPMLQAMASAKSASVKMAPPITFPVALRWISVSFISQTACPRLASTTVQPAARVANWSFAK